MLNESKLTRFPHHLFLSIALATGPLMRTKQVVGFFPYLTLLRVEIARFTSSLPPSLSCGGFEEIVTVALPPQIAADPPPADILSAL